MDTYLAIGFMYCVFCSWEMYHYIKSGYTCPWLDREAIQVKRWELVKMTGERNADIFTVTIFAILLPVTLVVWPIFLGRTLYKIYVWRKSK